LLINDGMRNTGWQVGRKAYMFPKLAVVGVLNLRKTGPIRWRPSEEGETRGKEKKTNLVKVILVELANEGRKIGVFKHPREDGLCELVHILSREIRGSNHISARGETIADLDYKAVAIRPP
jgi:hypothetical protein